MDTPTPPPRSPTHRALGWTAFALVAGIALFQVWRYRIFFYDDAYISLRYAQRWITGNGLTFTDGEKVEGYTNLLWVLGCGGLAYYGVPWTVTPRVLGGIGLAIVLWTASVDPRALLRPVWSRALLAGGLAATTGGIAIWTVGGLEHTWLAGFAALAALATIRAADQPTPGRLAAAGILFWAVVWTRADAALLWGLALVGLAVSTPPRTWLRLWPVVAVPALAIGIQEAGRVLYYGDWVPNTARAKVAFTFARTWHGLTWVADALLHHVALFGAALFALRRPPLEPRIAVPLAMAVGWTAYVAWVGGDFMAGWRLLVPAFGPLLLLASEAAVRIEDRWGTRVLAGFTVAALLVNAVGANHGRWIDKAFDMSGWVIAPPIANALRIAFKGTNPLLAVDAAGALPFYTRFRTLDLLGLTDRTLALTPPATFGGDWIGHDLGNGEYVWSRKPDLLLFNGANGTTKPRYTSARQLQQRPGFNEAYQYVNFRVPIDGKLFPVHLYVRKIDGPLAIGLTQDRVDVPGWFFAQRDGPIALLEDKRLVTRVTAENPGQLMDVFVPAGTWAVAADPSVTVEIACKGEPATKLGDGPLVIELLRARKLDFVVRPTGESGRFARLTLKRTDKPATLLCGRRGLSTGNPESP